MKGRIILAIATVFISWSILDFVLHGFLLRSSYEATANLWRPMDQMNMPLMYLVTLASAACFVLIYGLLVKGKSVTAGVEFGLLWGLAAGISMGFGSYTFMPIPVNLALGWFLGCWFEAIAAGVIAGALIKA
jgi:hypothetical protein